MILSRRQRESLLDEVAKMIANKQNVAFANCSKISERVSNNDLSFYINSVDKAFIMKYANNTMTFNCKEKTFSELNALIFSNKNKITGISDTSKNDSNIALSTRWAYNKDIETLKRMRKYNPDGLSGSGTVDIIGITDDNTYSQQHLLTYEYWKEHQEEQQEEDEKNYDNRYAMKDHIHQEYATKQELLLKSDITHDHSDKYLTKDELNKIETGNHQGIILEVDDYKYSSIDDLNDDIIVMLDHLEDPHNFGAIIRTCEAAGITSIIIPKDRSIKVNATVMKTSVGTLEDVNICMVTNLVNAIKKLKENGFWIIGTDMEGTNYRKIDYQGKIAIVIGNEGKGLSRLTKENCDFIAKIPMYGKVNSLNASVAAALVIYEAVMNR